jgi:hypothetical protein
MIMKTKVLFFAAILSLSITSLKAQTEIPAGYVKGSVTLADNSVVQGYVKDNLKRSAAVSFIDNAGKKTNYNGIDINGATIDAVNFICIKGDFFKTISAGKLTFLQKSSDASNKATFNGTDATFNTGTEGKMGDYFVYRNNELKLLNKKSLESFITNDLSGCTAAIEKAKSANGDIAKMKDAVDIYNSTN